jgi:hypothetical protein
MLRVLSVEQVQDLQADIRQVLRTQGAASNPLSSLNSRSNPFIKKTLPPLPLVFEFFGPDKKFKGLSAVQRSNLVRDLKGGKKQGQGGGFLQIAKHAIHSILSLVSSMKLVHVLLLST